jgi:hypothetical protein
MMMTRPVLRRSQRMAYLVVAALLVTQAPSAAASAAAPAQAMRARAMRADAMQALAAGPVEGNIVAAHSGRCLDVTGGTGATANEVPIKQYDCLGAAQTNQIWSLRYVDHDGDIFYYSLVAAHSGKCLDVTGGPAATGNQVPIKQYACSGATNQQFRLQYYALDDPRVNLVARHSQKCLDVIGGTGATGNNVAIQQYTCLGAGQTNQLFTLY